MVFEGFHFPNKEIYQLYLEEISMQKLHLSISVYKMQVQGQFQYIFKKGKEILEKKKKRAKAKNETK